MVAQYGGSLNRLFYRLAPTYTTLMENFSNPTVYTLYLTYACYYLPRKTDSVVKSSLEVDGFSIEQIAFSDTVYLLTYTITILFAGMYGSSIPANKFLCYSLTALAIVSFLKGLVSAPMHYIALQLLHAMIQSTGWPTCVRVLSLWVVKDRGLVMGVWTTCQSFGGIFGAMVASYFVNGYSRQMAYFVNVPFCLFTAYLAYKNVEDENSKQQEYTAVVDVEKERAKKDHLDHRRGGDGSKTKLDQPKVTFSQLLCKPGIMLVGIGYFFLKFVRYALLMWLPFYYEEGLHFDGLTAGFMSTSFEMGGVIGTPLIGYVSDQYLGGDNSRTAALFLAGASVMLFACNIVANMGIFLNQFFMVMVGILIIGPDSIISATIISDLVRDNGLSPQDTGSVAGLINSMGSSGSIFQSGATALITQYYSWTALFNSFVFFSLLSSSILMASIWLRNRKSISLLRG
mmetsp:Transcript_8960/g.10255  ORF Transcript_8960/g.10255 Transcript_8960/m.10255 type:complete len:457 (+) Transcript_8960:204-1574(+)